MNKKLEIVLGYTKDLMFKTCDLSELLLVVNICFRPKQLAVCLPLKGTIRARVHILTPHCDVA